MKWERDFKSLSSHLNMFRSSLNFQTKTSSQIFTPLVNYKSVQQSPLTTIKIKQESNTQIPLELNPLNHTKDNALTKKSDLT